jgi:cytochrome b561
MSTTADPGAFSSPAGPPRHAPATILLHWGAAVVLVAAFGLGLAMEEWPRGPQRDAAMMLHYSAGTVLLATVLLRLLGRLLLPRPKPEAGILARRAAGVLHAALYALMVALPLSGAMDRWARGRPLRVFGDILVPAPFPIPGGKLWEEVHEAAAWTLAALVGVHVLAALWHHLVQRDDVLRRMLPARG